MGMKKKIDWSTLSYFGETFRHDMSKGFPPNHKEDDQNNDYRIKVVLKGGTNIKYLEHNGCNIWNGVNKQYKRI